MCFTNQSDRRLQIIASVGPFRQHGTCSDPYIGSGATLVKRRKISVIWCVSVQRNAGQSPPTLTLSTTRTQHKSRLNRDEPLLTLLISARSCLSTSDWSKALLVIGLLASQYLFVDAVHRFFAKSSLNSPYSFLRSSLLLSRPLAARCSQ